FASLDYLDHQPEVYHLTAGIYVDREALLSRRLANVIVRPGLALNGTPVSVGILEDVKLRIAATDQDGTVTTLEVPDFKLFEDRESVHEFRVPPRLASLAVTLTAKVKSLSQATKIDLAAGDRQRRRHRPGGDGPHLAAARGPAHLPPRRPRPRRRDGDVSVPRLGGRAVARRARTLRGPRRPDPRRPVRRPGRPRRPAGA